MPIVSITIVVSLLLVWGAILALLYWVPSLEHKHLLGLGGFVSLVSAALIYIVLQTSLIQQEKALEQTQNRLNQELNTFRKRLEEQSDRIFSQTNEKLEYTQSELEIRAKLDTERDDHNRTRKTLLETQQILQNTQTQHTQEAAAHKAYLDSLNTERATHAATRTQLEGEKQNLSIAQRDLQTTLINVQQAQQNHQQTQEDLRQTRQVFDQTQQTLAQTKAQLAAKTTEIEHLQTQIKETEIRLQQAKTSVESALKQELARQQNTLNFLQTAVDSIYEKLLKKPRVITP